MQMSTKDFMVLGQSPGCVRFPADVCLNQSLVAATEGSPLRLELRKWFFHEVCRS
jgi:hypothetical protein